MEPAACGCESGGTSEQTMFRKGGRTTHFLVRHTHPPIIDFRPRGDLQDEAVIADGRVVIIAANALGQYFESRSEDDCVVNHDKTQSTAPIV